MRITLNGNLGSGKSTIGKMLSARLGIPYISTGAIFRDIGKISNLDALQTNLAAEDNSEIDFAVDKKISDLNEKFGDFIIDSRMAWHFVGNAIHVFLSVTPATAARRIYQDGERQNETYGNQLSALTSIERRRQSEVRRYKKLYGVDIEDLGNYGLFIITDDARPASIVEIICQHLRTKKHKFWIPKKRLVPMIGIRDVSGIVFATRSTFDEIVELPLMIDSNLGFFFDGAALLVHSLFFELDMVPYIPSEKTFLSNDENLVSLAIKTLKLSDIYDWEALSGVDLTFKNQLLGRTIVSDASA